MMNDPPMESLLAEFLAQQKLQVGMGLFASYTIVCDNAASLPPTWLQSLPKAREVHLQSVMEGRVQPPAAHNRWGNDKQDEDPSTALAPNQHFDPSSNSSNRISNLPPRAPRKQLSPPPTSRIRVRIPCQNSLFSPMIPEPPTNGSPKGSFLPPRCPTRQSSFKDLLIVDPSPEEKIQPKRGRRTLDCKPMPRMVPLESPPSSPTGNGSSSKMPPLAPLDSPTDTAARLWRNDWLSASSSVVALSSPNARIIRMLPAASDSLSSATTSSSSCGSWSVGHVETIPSKLSSPSSDETNLKTVAYHNSNKQHRWRCKNVERDDEAKLTKHPQKQKLRARSRAHRKARALIHSLQDCRLSPDGSTSSDSCVGKVP